MRARVKGSPDAANAFLIFCASPDVSTTDGSFRKAMLGSTDRKEVSVDVSVVVTVDVTVVVTVEVAVDVAEVVTVEEVNTEIKNDKGHPKIRN